MVRWTVLLAMLPLGVLVGCGSTRWSDTQRTATEQLLLSDAMDRAVNRIDFHVLAGKTVYLDATAVRGSTDAAYLASSLRQQMFAHGCTVKDKRDEADYVVEVRAGVIGTDRSDVLFGVPATRMPEMGAMGGGATAIPELPLAKKTEQRAVAKIALFAFNRETGHPVWQSGTIPVESKTKDVWVLGAGPFQRSALVDDVKASDPKSKSKLALFPARDKAPAKSRPLGVTDEVVYAEPPESLPRRLTPPKDEVAQAMTPGKRKEPGAGKTPPPGPEQKPPESRSPLDDVVPAGHFAPIGGGPSVSSQPNSGMDGFWNSPAVNPAANPAMPNAAPGAAPAAPAPLPAAPANLAPLGGWIHGVMPKG